MDHLKSVRDKLEISGWATRNQRMGYLKSADELLEISGWDS
jgi:hypothetical protein